MFHFSGWHIPFDLAHQKITDNKAEVQKQKIKIKKSQIYVEKKKKKNENGIANVGRRLCTVDSN